jgi:hypothetical protein
LYKKKNEGGEKTGSSDDKFVFAKKKAVQKTNSSNDDFEEKNWLMEMRVVMNQKGIKLSHSINQPLSAEDSNKTNLIIQSHWTIIYCMKTNVFHGTVCGDF